MATHKGGDGRWRFRFSFRGQRYSGSAPRIHNTKLAAEKLERHLMDKLLRGEPIGTIPTVAEFVERFIDHQEARTKPLTFKHQKAMLANHVVPHYGLLSVVRAAQHWASIRHRSASDDDLLYRALSALEADR